MSAEETRHPDWIPVEPGDGAIRGGDRYRFERPEGAAYEFDASYDWEQKDFLPGATYFIWPRPEKKPYEAIPEGKENAKFMAVSVDSGEPVVGMYFRIGGVVGATSPGGSGFSYSVCRNERVTSAVPVAFVQSEALDELRTVRDKWLSDEETDVNAYHVVKQVDLFLTEIDRADQ